MRVVTILAVLVIAPALAGCQTTVKTEGLTQCITVTAADAEQISDHLVNQIVAHNEALGC